MKTQDYGLFADLLTFLAIFLAINTPDRGQNMTSRTPFLPGNRGRKIFQPLPGHTGKRGVVLEEIIAASLLRKQPRTVTLISGVCFAPTHPRGALPKVLDNRGRWLEYYRGNEDLLSKVSGVNGASGCPGTTDCRA